MEEFVEVSLRIASFYGTNFEIQSTCVSCMLISSCTKVHLFNLRRDTLFLECFEVVQKLATRVLSGSHLLKN